MPDRPDADLKRLSQEWQGRISDALKRREDGWLKDAEMAEAAYSLNDTYGRTPDFNIIYSNTETIVPAVFNSMPVPDIRERHRQGDKVARVAADILENVVSVQIDDAALDTEVEDVTRDANVAGRGVLRVRFSADTDEAGQVTNERVTYEAVSWRDYLEGPAGRFGQLPWVAFRHRLARDEQDRLTDKDMFERQQVEGEEDQRKEREDVWEVWCKKTRKVYFLRNSDWKFLSEKDDPLELKGFFPVCKPVQPVTLTGRRDPIVPYKLYQKLATELDMLTRRINALIKGLKAKGGVVTSAGDIEKLAQADDNEIITFDNAEALANIGIDNAILWWPIDRIIATVKELYVAREQTKQTIYEVTGISDIVRGASESRETATAQQIKTQWGSLRIKRFQTMIERLVREAFVMTVELIGSKFSAETIQAQAGIQMDEQVLLLLQSPLMHYRVDVESDSTVRGDLSRQKGEMTEFLKGTAEFFATMGQVVMQSPAVAGPVVALYASFARSYNLGRQAEDALDELVELAGQVAQQPQENPEAQAKQAEMQAKLQEFQGKMEIEAQRLQMDQQRAQADVAVNGQKLELDRAKAETDVQLKREQAQADLAVKDREIQIKEAELELKRMDMALKEQDLGIKARQTELSAGEAEVEGSRGKIEEMMAKLEEEHNGLADAMAKMADAIAQQSEATTQMGEKLAAAMSRKRSVVRDPKTGQVVGVE